MSLVYLCWHIREDERTSESSKLVGCFSTYERARAAVDDLHSKPGFVDHPQGFQIDEYAVDKVHWEDGFGSDPVVDHGLG